MKACEIDALAIEDACNNLSGIKSILANMAVAVASGEGEVHADALTFLYRQIDEQRKRIETATASAWVPSVAI